MKQESTIKGKIEQENAQLADLEKKWWENISIHEYYEISVTHDPNSTEFNDEFIDY